MCTCDCPVITAPEEDETISSSTEVTVEFEASEGASTYHVYVWETGTDFPGSSADILDDGSATYSTTISGLEAGTSYNLAVLAECACPEEDGGNGGQLAGSGAAVGGWAQGGLHGLPGFGEEATKLVAGPINRVVNKNVLRIVTMLENLVDKDGNGATLPEVSAFLSIDLNGHNLLNLADDAGETTPARRA